MACLGSSRSRSDRDVIALRDSAAGTSFLCSLRSARRGSPAPRHPFGSSIGLESRDARKVLADIQQAMPLYTQAAEVARKADQLALVEHVESKIQELKKVITRSALLRRQISQHRQQQNFAEALNGIAGLRKIGIFGLEKPDDLDYLEQYVHFELYEQQFLGAYSGWSVKLPAEEKASRTAQMGQALDELEKLASGLDDSQQRRLVEYRKNYGTVS